MIAPVFQFGTAKFYLLLISISLYFSGIALFFGVNIPYISSTILMFSLLGLIFIFSFIPSCRLEIKSIIIISCLLVVNIFVNWLFYLLNLTPGYDWLDVINLMFFYVGLSFIWPFNINLFSFNRKIRFIILFILFLIYTPIIYYINFFLLGFPYTEFASIGLALLITFIVANTRDNKGAMLRIINGHLAGQNFILEKDVITIGSSINDDIYIAKYLGVDKKATILKHFLDPKCYQIDSNALDQPIQVNFRQCQSQILETEDIISIGSLRLQFIIR